MGGPTLGEVRDAQTCIRTLHLCSHYFSRKSVTIALCYAPLYLLRGALAPHAIFFCFAGIVCTSRCSRIIPITSSSRAHHMVTPDYKGFVQLSRDASLIPVAKTLSADLLTPVGAFLGLAAKQQYAFLLESVEGGEKIGRYTFVGAQPSMVVTARGSSLEIRRGP